MIAFIVATPLQLFNSINIMLSKYPDEKVDYFVLSYAVNNMRTYMKNITKVGFVANIFYLENYCNWHGKVGVIKDYFFENKSFFYENQYDVLYTTWIGDRSSLFYNTLSKKNPKISLHFYEEGIGIYIHDICNYGNQLLLMYKVFHIKHDKQYVDFIEGYRPEMIFSKDNFKTAAIPLIDKSDLNFKNKINHIFNYREAAPYNEKNIYLEDCFFRDKKDERYKIFSSLDQVKLLKYIEKFVDKDNLLIRKHPITKHSDYENALYKVDSNTEYAWELILLNEDMSSKTLISIISTAVFSPKMMFDEEPVVMILGKALKNEFTGKEPWADLLWTDSFAELVSKFKSLYRNPNRVLVPDSLKELDDHYEQISKVGSRNVY